MWKKWKMLSKLQTSQNLNIFFVVVVANIMAAFQGQHNESGFRL